MVDSGIYGPQTTESLPISTSGHAIGAPRIMSAVTGEQSRPASIDFLQSGSGPISRSGHAIGAPWMMSTVTGEQSRPVSIVFLQSGAALVGWKQCLAYVSTRKGKFDLKKFTRRKVIKAKDSYIII